MRCVNFIRCSIWLQSMLSNANPEGRTVMLRDTHNIKDNSIFNDNIGLGNTQFSVAIQIHRRMLTFYGFLRATLIESH